MTTRPGGYEGRVLPYAPRWKTLRGAKRWAEKNGLEFVG